MYPQLLAGSGPASSSHAHPQMSWLQAYNLHMPLICTQSDIDRDAGAAGGLCSLQALDGWT